MKTSLITTEGVPTAVGEHAHAPHAGTVDVTVGVGVTLVEEVADADSVKEGAAWVALAVQEATDVAVTVDGNVVEALAVEVGESEGLAVPVAAPGVPLDERVAVGVHVSVVVAVSVLVPVALGLAGGEGVELRVAVTLAVGTGTVDVDAGVELGEMVGAGVGVGRGLVVAQAERNANTAAIAPAAAANETVERRIGFPVRGMRRSASSGSG